MVILDDQGKSMAGTKNKFKKITGKKNIFAHLNNTRKRKEKILAWKHVNDVKIITELSLKTVSSYRQELIFEFEKSKHSVLKEISFGHDTVNFFIPSLSCLFNAPLISLDDDTLKVSIPDTIYQLDRRKAFRLNINDKCPVKVKFYKSYFNQSGQIQTHQIEKFCNDISTGGLSLILTKDQSKIFDKDEIISSVGIWFEDQYEEFDAKIVGIVPVEPDEFNKLYYKGVKISLKFSEVGPDLINKLESFIFKNMDDIPIPTSA